MNFSTFMKTSNDIPTIFFTVQSSINICIIVDFRGLKTNYYNTTGGINLMMKPTSNKALENLDVLMVQGIMKSLGTTLFYARDLYVFTQQ